jgi:hypothetical protein
MFGDTATPALKVLEMGGLIEDDPTKSMLMIYGKENGGTTTLASSIIDVIDPEKKIYVLLTEMPHNVTGILNKHYNKEFKEGRFILPTVQHGERTFARPVSSQSDFIQWKNAMIRKNSDGSYDLRKEDCGCIIVDALDTLREILYSYYLAKNPKKGTINYAEADNDIINQLFLPLSFQNIPIIVILKHKPKTDWISDEKTGALLRVEKIKNEDGTQKIVPTIDGEKIMRWTTIRLWCENEAGSYEIMKTKGHVEEGEVFSFGFKKGSKTEKTGVWLKQLFEKMRDGKPSAETFNSL